MHVFLMKTDNDNQWFYHLSYNFYACFWYFLNEDFKCEFAIESLVERKCTGSLLEWKICDDSDQWESQDMSTVTIH